MKGNKRKVIIERCDKKITKWLSTITDIELRDRVKKDIILTGGSIASMLLGEEVNDYDVYFKTHDVAKDLSEYYVKIFNESKTSTAKVDVLNGSDICDETKELLKKKYGNYASLIDPKRIYLFIRSLGVARDNLKNEEKYLPKFISDNCITLTDDVQIIVRFNGTVKEIHENFDFVHATCSFEYDESGKGVVNLPSKALESLLSKDLYYIGSLYPLCSLFRLRKFINRGWHITGGQILKMAFQASELDLTDVNILADQLIGVDTTYFKWFIQELRKKQEADAEFKVDATYIAKLVDVVFE